MFNDKINQESLKKIKLFQKYNKHYYDLNNPLVNDQEFDELKLEIIKLEKKYKTLVDDHDNLSRKLEELQNREKAEEKKRLEFSEKIDELNQETNTLMDEIDKWQT